MKALRRWSKEGACTRKPGKPMLWNQESQRKEEGSELTRKTIYFQSKTFGMQPRRAIPDIQISLLYLYGDVE